MHSDEIGEKEETRFFAQEFRILVNLSASFVRVIRLQHTQFYWKFFPER
jgi:hypothetical protein